MLGNESKTLASTILFSQKLMNIPNLKALILPGKLLLLTFLLGLSSKLHAQPLQENTVTASLTGVHHLGPNHLIYKFHVNKSISDNISRGGGGGSEVCCIMLPRSWTPTLLADVRWLVVHFIKSADPTASEKSEIEGIYHALVPIEKYTEPGNLYVHFFPNGRVRVVVSTFTSDSEEHPVKPGDSSASRIASVGRAARALFTPAEEAELKQKAEQARKEHRGWR